MIANVENREHHVDSSWNLWVSDCPQSYTRGFLQIFQVFDVSLHNVFLNSSDSVRLFSLQVKVLNVTKTAVSCASLEFCETTGHVALLRKMDTFLRL